MRESEIQTDVQLYILVLYIESRWDRDPKTETEGVEGQREIQTELESGGGTETYTNRDRERGRDREIYKQR